MHKPLAFLLSLIFISVSVSALSWSGGFEYANVNNSQYWQGYTPQSYNTTFLIGYNRFNYNQTGLGLTTDTLQSVTNAGSNTSNLSTFFGGLNVGVNSTGVISHTYELLYQTYPSSISWLKYSTSTVSQATLEVNPATGTGAWTEKPDYSAYMNGPYYQGVCVGEENTYAGAITRWKIQEDRTFLTKFNSAINTNNSYYSYTKVWNHTSSAWVTLADNNNFTGDITNFVDSSGYLYTIFVSNTIFDDCMWFGAQTLKVYSTAREMRTDGKYYGDLTLYGNLLFGDTGYPIGSNATRIPKMFVKEFSVFNGNFTGDWGKNGMVLSGKPSATQALATFTHNGSAGLTYGFLGTSLTTTSSYGAGLLWLTSGYSHTSAQASTIRAQSSIQGSGGTFDNYDAVVQMNTPGATRNMNGYSCTTIVNQGLGNVSCFNNPTRFNNTLGWDNSTSKFGTAGDSGIKFDGVFMNIIANLINTSDGMRLESGRKGINLSINYNQKLFVNETETRISNNITAINLLSTDYLIKLKSITLPACALATNGTIGRNNTDFYKCRHGNGVWEAI